MFLIISSTGQRLPLSELGGVGPPGGPIGPGMPHNTGPGQMPPGSTAPPLMGHQQQIGPNQNGLQNQGHLGPGQNMGANQGMGRGMMGDNKKGLMRQGSLGQNQTPMMGLGDFNSPKSQSMMSPQIHGMNGQMSQAKMLLAQATQGAPPQQTWPSGGMPSSGPTDMTNKTTHGSSKFNVEL